MLSSSVLTLGPVSRDEIKYVTSSLADGKFKILVFTSQHVLVGMVDDATQNDAEFEVRSYPLQGFTSVGVLTEESFFGQDDFGAWPGEVRVAVDHPELGSFQLPLSRNGDNMARAAFEKYLPALLSLID